MVLSLVIKSLKIKYFLPIGYHISELHNKVCPFCNKIFFILIKSCLLHINKCCRISSIITLKNTQVLYVLLFSGREHQYIPAAIKGF